MNVNDSQWVARALEQRGFVEKPGKVNRGLRLPQIKIERKAEDFAVWKGRSIVHKRFGGGVITAVEGSMATIRFDAGEKTLDLRTCVDNGLITVKKE
jgi:hypothetical protein